MSIRDRAAAASAPAWIAKERGDVLSGTVANISTRTTEYGPYTIVTVDPDEAPVSGGSTTFTVRIDGDDLPYHSGPLAWHAMGAVAEKRVAEHRPQVGDEFAVIFDGKRVAQSGTGKGKAYDTWNVAVKHNSIVTAEPETPSVVEHPPETPVSEPESVGAFDPDDEEPF